MRTCPQPTSVLAYSWRQRRQHASFNRAPPAPCIVRTRCPASHCMPHSSVTAPFLAPFLHGLPRSSPLQSQPRAADTRARGGPLRVLSFSISRSPVVNALAAPNRSNLSSPAANSAISVAEFKWRSSTDAPCRTPTATGGKAQRRPNKRHVIDAGPNNQGARQPHSRKARLARANTFIHII